FTLISNSDAHSPGKLGRNANLFDTELSYDSITGALKSGDPRRCLGTIDLFPQEGKYHYDGHRKCGVCWNPVETLENSGVCPVCQKKVTVGVLNRVVRISDREDLTGKKNRLPFYSIIPLKEILSEILGVSPASRKVDREYFTLLKKGIPELELLLDTPVEEIALLGSAELAEGVKRMRNRQIIVKEGFDGEYGRVKVFQKDEKATFSTQKALFSEPPRRVAVVLERREMIAFDLSKYRELAKAQEQSDENTKLNKSFLGGQGGRFFKKAPLALNSRQREAARHFEGPALILAGPGTGKTRVLVYRIAHLIEDKGIDPGHILAVTFTNRAAAEMKERLQGLLRDSETCSKMQVATFHALGLSMLKELSVPGNNILSNSLREEIGRHEGFSLIDQEDRKLLLRRIPGCEKRRVNKFSEAISRAKQEIKTAAEIEDKKFAGIFENYETLLKEQNCFDLDDLIYVPVKLFSRCPGMQEHYGDKYRWIMVDEYQDINYAQYRLIGSLIPGASTAAASPAERANLCVIGDPDQAIYGFRGADVAFIEKFSVDFPDAVLYKLEKSYRCSESILRASRDVMGGAGRGGLSGGVLEGVNKGVKIKIAKHGTHKSEAEFVARTIEDMIGGLRFFSMDSSITQGSKSGPIESLSDFAVLCRVRSQLEAVEKACRDHAVPFRTIGDLPFFKQEPVRSIIDLLRSIQNPANSFLKEKFQNEKINRFLASGGEGGFFEKPPPSTPRKTFIDFKAQKTVKEIVSVLVDDFFDAEKKENEIAIRQLLDLAGNFDRDLDGFLRFVLLGAAEDTYAPSLENVTLMTLHAAKGLEFKCVFIVGCEEGLLPYSLYESQTCDREEERRLLYVGMTRAQEFLFLSHAEKRFLRGREYRLPRSSFLDPIEKELLESAQMKQRKKKEPEVVQRSLFDSDEL
ncbi:MAG: UvrD-helicase domain-containing protein, partial [Candidatus Aminicenantes bacterium]|nr:UvrD-helicase domain-containing protein [Candidatus Aminicenantes bacterium]